MKKIFAVLSFALLVAACGSIRGNLLSRVEYHDDEVFDREEYHYSSDGELALVTRVIYFNNTPDSSWTEYEIRQNGQITDTIETINSNMRNIKSSDGTVRTYNLVGDEWEETSFHKRNEKGTYIDYKTSDYHSWNTYDSLGRSTGNAYILVRDNGEIQKGGSRIEFSADGLESILTEYYQIDSLQPVILFKSICKYDKKGRILSREAYDPDETDDNYPTFLTDTYKYRGNKIIRIESTKEYKDGSYHKEPGIKFKEKYKHGLRTKIVAYMMKDGKFRKQSVNTWKYDFRAKVPLKSFVYSPSDYLIFRRPWQKTVWTYENLSGRYQSLGHNHNAITLLRLDMAFDTVVQVVRGQNRLEIRKNIDNEDGSIIKRTTTYVYAQNRSTITAFRDDSIFGIDGNLIDVLHFKCKDLKDTVFVFAETPLQFKIPVNSDSGWSQYQLNDSPETKVYYDRLGRVVIKETDNEKTEYTYDENDRCVLEITSSDYSNTVITTEFTYNNAGYLVSSTTKNNDVISYKLEHKYDNNGRLAEELQNIYEDGQQTELIKERYRYDTYGRVIKDDYLCRTVRKEILRHYTLRYTYNDKAGIITSRNVSKWHPEGKDPEYIFDYYSFRNSWSL